MLTESERLARNAYQVAFYHRHKERLNAERSAARRAQIERDPEAFHTKMRAYRAGRKDERNAELRRQRKENPEKFRARERAQKLKDPDLARRKRIKKVFGLTVAEYDARIAAQNGVCASCGDEVEKLVLDHSHTDGRVRGVLCNKCNVALGMVDDSPDRLLALVRYLEKYPA